MDAILAMILGNPAMLTALLGMAIKFGTDRLKVIFANVDAEGVPAGYKVPVQIMVTVCTGLATLGTLALKGQLSTFDMSLLVNFLTTALPAMLASVGIHVGGKALLEKTLGRPTLLKK